MSMKYNVRLSAYGWSYQDYWHFQGVANRRIVELLARDRLGAATMAALEVAMNTNQKFEHWWDARGGTSYLIVEPIKSNESEKDQAALAANQQ